MENTIKIGVIGLGMGKGHCVGAVACERTELAAIAEPSEERRKILYERIGREVPAYDDYREMIDGAGLDAVVIALPTDMHAESSLFALSRGMHVLCEKPPTTTAGEMREVAKVAADSGRVYMFARQQRFKRSALHARQLVKDGVLGRVYHGESKWFRARSIPFRNGWGVNRDAGGGVLLDLGVHSIDAAWFVMGCPRPVSVLAAAHCAFSRFAPPDLTMPYDAEDSVFALIRFEDGASLIIGDSFALNAEAPPGAWDGSRPFPDWAELRIMGDLKGMDVKACRLIDNSGERLEVVETDPWEGFTGNRGNYQPMNVQMEEFARAIVENDAPLNTAEQALYLMEMLDAIKESAETGRSVRLGGNE